MWTSLGGLTRRRADRIVVNKLDVRELKIPLILALVDDYSQFLGHGVIHPLNAYVAVWKVGGCDKFMGAQKLINSS